jgi:transcriptional regulator with XRE-family HTH domain
MAPPGTFGELLRYHRTNAHRTQAEFAKHAGISLDVLTALENGHWAGDDKTVQRIAVALFLSQAQEKALTEAWEALRRPSILP